MCRNPVALWKLKEVCDVSVIGHICKIFNMFVHSHTYIFIFSELCITAFKVPKNICCVDAAINRQ